MALAAWLLLGIGIFLVYCAVKGLNPLDRIKGVLGS